MFVLSIAYTYNRTSRICFAQELISLLLKNLFYQGTHFFKFLEELGQRHAIILFDHAISGMQLLHVQVVCIIVLRQFLRTSILCKGSIGNTVVVVTL